MPYPEYLSNRVILHDLIFDQNRLRADRESFGMPVGPSIVAEIAEPTLVAALLANAKPPRPGLGQQLKALMGQVMSLKNIKDLDARFAQTTPEEQAAQVEKLNQVYRGLFARADAPYLERIRKSTELPLALDAVDVHTRVTRGLVSSFDAFAKGMAWSAAWMRDAQGLVAVRRWQLRHGGELPPSLDVAAREAGLPGVPTDPYDGRPIRLVVVDGQPTIYSIGQDGRDDSGNRDAVRSPYLGDVLLRLPRP